MNMNQINTHALREVVEDSLYSLVMWIDEAYAYDSRQLEEIPCDDVAANYLATIACCLDTNNTKEETEMGMKKFNSVEELEFFVCDWCGEIYAQPSLCREGHSEELCVNCHSMTLDNTKEEISMYDDYEDELEAGRQRDEERNEEFCKWLKE